MIKHSIIINCYNQEVYIKKALDSLLNEQTKPFEIIIGDDCSQDNTQKILNEYKSTYPNIIKLIFHKENLGIFSNLNEILKFATGDMIHFLAGDDWFAPGFLESVNKTIETNKLDPKHQSFILLPKVVLHHPDGMEVRVQNSLKDLETYSPTGMALRGITKWRLVCISQNLFSKFPLFEKDANILGPWTDRVQFVLLSQYIDSQYLMWSDGAIYRTGIGISSKVDKKLLQNSYLLSLERIYFHHKNHNLVLNSRDILYLKFIISCYKMRHNFSLLNFYSYLVNTFMLLINSANDIRFVCKEFYTDLRKLLFRDFFI